MSRQRAAIYTRVSTEEQAKGHTEAAERDLLERWAALEGWDVVAYYNDPGYSAKDMEKAPRPQFNRAIGEAGRVFDILLVEKQDRFARNIGDAYAVKKALKAAGARVMYYNERAANEQSPSGLLMEAIGFAQAEGYLLDLSVKIAKGYHAKAVLKGLHIGDVPFGYVAPADPKSEPMRLDPHEAAGVLWAFETYALGESSYEEIGQGLATRGYRPHSRQGRTGWSMSTVRKLLSNEVYLGLVPYHGEFYPGKHEPVPGLTRALFEQVRAVSQRRRHGGRTSHRTVGEGRPAHVYMLTGLGRCARCGSRLWGDAGQPKDRRNHRYYRCSSRRTSSVTCADARRGLRADRIEPSVGHTIVDTGQRLRKLDELVREMARRTAPVDAEAERQRIREVIRRATLALTLGGDEQVARRALAQAHAALEALGVPEEQQAATTMELVTNLALLWPRFTDQERREAAHLMFEDALVGIATGDLLLLPRPEYAPAYNAVVESGAGVISYAEEKVVLVPPERFELPTRGLGRRRSIP